MTEKNRNYCLRKAENYEDREAFLTDLTHSSIWGDCPENAAPVDLLEELGELFDLAHITVRQIRHATGLSQASFCTRYNIPRRTLEDWETGVRKPPLYVKLFLAEIVGLWNRKKD